MNLTPEEQEDLVEAIRVHNEIMRCRVDLSSEPDLPPYTEEEMNRVPETLHPVNQRFFA